MLFWKNEKYEEMDYPLAFVELHNLRNKEIVEVLSKFDTLYGDTDQDTEEWALEFQVLTRLLVKHHAILINPKYLALNEAVEKFQRILGKEKFERFQNGVNMSMDLIRKKYNNAEAN